MEKQEFTEEQKEMAMEYQKYDLERKTIMNKLVEIGEEKREHELVCDTLLGIQDDDRKTWKLVNGHLIEKTKGEIVPELKSNIENIILLTGKLNERMQTLLTRMRKIESDLGQQIKIQHPAKEETKDDSAASKSAGGIVS
ncbi:unnamed protein product [Moneuplotes crassus]|uniref:Prefoldin subunit 2 n=1 Tax=Euplotes crassus TaxID=5936 RepID=A0AAD1XWG7_EUPCR|nr:unnamed protein product [Moneuplotes crassus]